MAAEVDALLDLIGKAATFAKLITSRWFKASAAMNSFPSKLTILKQRSDNWTALLKRYGRSADEFIKPVLEQASRLLVDEEARLQRFQSKRGLRFWHKLLFPDSVTASLDNIIATFEKLPQLMLEKEMIRQQLEKGAGQVALLPFGSDPKYVVFHSTILKVQRALESETTGRVVTLYGGPGQGKTSMARYLAWLYQNPSTFVNPKARVQEETVPVSRMFIDGVVFLSCGLNKDSKDLLVELWENLGYELPYSTAEAKKDEDGSGGPQRSFISESFLYRELTRRLSGQKVLVVLDDVWESTPLEKVLIHGQGVKYLITTQNQQVWQDATCEQVPISTPTSEEASQILRNHVHGFPAHVPAELQDAINDIVEKCGRNPLVLANVATNISRGQASDLEEWRSTQKYLKDLIHDQDVKLRAVLFERTYSKPTIRASTTMALNSFVNEEQALLCLATLCETQPIPEVVLRIFFKKIHASLAKFPRYIEHLESNNFIHIQSTKVPWSSVPERSWSLHQLRQKAIGSIKEEEVKSMFDTLLGYKTHKDIVLALLVLYGQPRWRDEAAKALGIQVIQFTNGTLDSRSLQLTPIKPFVTLLKSDGEEWEEKSSLLVEQVIQEYLHSGELDDASVSMLLTMEETCSSSCEALLKMAALKNGQIFSQGYPKTLNALLNLVESVHKRASSIPERSIGLLFDEISLESMGSALEIGSIPSVFQRLVAFLADDINSSTQYRALRAFKTLTCQVAEKKINFGLIPHAIERVVALLADPTMQGVAADTMVNISCGVAENRIKIASCPGAIENLVALLGKDNDAQTQVCAAATLGNVSFWEVENLKKIGSFPGAMERLVRLLDRDVWLGTQMVAATTLANLSCTVEENRIKLQKALQQSPSIVESVMHSASVRHSKDVEDESHLQYWAAKLFELAFGTTECKIGGYLSNRAYLGEGDARVNAGDYKGALGSYENGLAIDCEDPELLSRRCFVRARLGDLSEALSLVTDDYESLKHRGFVKFLMSDEDGARADAENAMKTSTAGGVSKFSFEYKAYLGTSSVEYLGYKLT